MKRAWGILLVVLWFSLSIFSSCSKNGGRKTLSADQVSGIDLVTDHSLMYTGCDGSFVDWELYMYELVCALEDNDIDGFVEWLDIIGEHYTDMAEHIEELEESLEDVRDILNLD